MRRADSRALARIRSGAVAQGVDPVSFPERVSAFPSSGKDTGSTARSYRVSAFPLAQIKRKGADGALKSKK
jgi:hypothetical protein